MLNPGERRHASAWSLSDCILFTLEFKDFQAVLARFDKDNVIFTQMKQISSCHAINQSKVNTVRRKSADRAHLAQETLGADAGVKSSDSSS